ncbi:MAG: DUF4199 domain-containing protein [Balneolaceae bacterium]|nr:DUF4199 domain-containing protein [Balneolaceae bacterium]
MKKIVFTYGVLAGAINTVIAYLLTTIAGDDLMHANAEWVGYLIMIIALSIIFVGIKQYRDKHLGGIIKFGKAFLTGLYIALVASVIYVGVWEIYMQTSGEGFIDTYQASYMETLRAEGATAKELAEASEKMEYYKKMYSNTFLRMLITLSEILPVGIIISLISALLLKNSTVLPASDEDTTSQHLQTD